jgi:hypothetical protein
VTGRRIHHAARWLRTVGALLLTAAAVEYGVVPRVVEAASELSLVRDVSPWLVVGAGCVELLSLAAYTGLTQRLLGPLALRTTTQLRIDLTGYGLSHVLPGSGATAAALRYRLMVTRGVPEAEAASLTAVQAVLAVLGLVAAWALGSLLSLPRTGSVPTAVILAVLAIAAALGGQWLARGGRLGNASCASPARCWVGCRAGWLAPSQQRFAAPWTRCATRMRSAPDWRGVPRTGCSTRSACGCACAGTARTWPPSWCWSAMGSRCWSVCSRSRRGVWASWRGC